MLGACMICMATSGSGAVIGTRALTPIPELPTLRARPPALTAFSAAAVGTSIRGSPDQPLETGSIPASGTPSSGFEWFVFLPWTLSDPLFSFALLLWVPKTPSAHGFAVWGNPSDTSHAGRDYFQATYIQTDLYQQSSCRLYNLGVESISLDSATEGSVE